MFVCLKMVFKRKAVTSKEASLPKKIKANSEKERDPSISPTSNAPSPVPSPLPEPKRRGRPPGSGKKTLLPAPHARGVAAPPARDIASQAADRSFSQGLLPAKARRLSVASVKTATDYQEGSSLVARPSQLNEYQDGGGVVDQWYWTAAKTASTLGPLFLSISMGCWALGIWAGSFPSAAEMQKLGAIGTVYLVVFCLTLGLNVILGLPIIVSTRLWTSVAYGKCKAHFRSELVTDFLVSQPMLLICKGHVLSWEVVILVMIPVIAAIILYAMNK